MLIVVVPPTKVITMLPVRAGPKLDAASKVTVPDVVPDPPDTIVIQVWSGAADHAQLAPVTVTDDRPLPPADEKLKVSGATDTAQPAACVMLMLAVPPG